MKPENVMLSGNGTVKIGDFGQSQFFGRRDVFNRTLGTPAYLGGCRLFSSSAVVIIASCLGVVCLRGLPRAPAQI